MRQLEENWDGYGAARPQTSVIGLAQEWTALLEALLARSAAAPATLHVSPTRVGRILIEWEDPTAQHEVALNPDGSTGFLHFNKATGHIETRKFTPATQVVVDPALLP